MPEPAIEAPPALIDDQGQFTDVFREQLPTYIGEEHQEFKGFDDIKGIAGLAKAFADTKSALGRKLDNVIQRPAEDAPDEQKAEYRAALLAELGGTTDPSEYVFNKPDVPEGLQYDQEMEDLFRGVFAELQVPKDIASALIDKFNAATLERAIKAAEAAEAEFEAQAKLFKQDYPGDDLLSTGRIAYYAIQHFASDELRKAVAASGVFEDAGNLQKWRQQGFDPDQLRVWANIGKQMRLSTVPRDGGGGGPSDALRQAQKDFPNSPEMWPKE